MKKRELRLLFTIFLLCFYAGILLYILFPLLHIDLLTNFFSILIFEGLGFILLSFFILSGILKSSYRPGFLIPIISLTIGYVILLHILNLGLFSLKHSIFVFLNMIVLFLYCLAVIPMFLAGKRYKKEN